MIGRVYFSITVNNKVKGFIYINIFEGDSPNEYAMVVYSILTQGNKLLSFSSSGLTMLKKFGGKWRTE